MGLQGEVYPFGNQGGWNPDVDFPAPDVLDDIRAGRYSPAPERFPYDDARVRRVEDNWYPDDTMALVEGPGINPNLTPEIEKQITDTFEQLLMRGSSPEEALEIVSLQFGDLL